MRRLALVLSVILSSRTTRAPQNILFDVGGAACFGDQPLKHIIKRFKDWGSFVLQPTGFCLEEKSYVLA